MQNSKLLLFYFVCFLFFFEIKSFSFENKIVAKIENKIITSIDIKNEYNYLLALNKELKNLNDKEFYELSKRSIIREKIKEIEISKYYDLDLPDEYIKSILKNIYLKLNIKNFKDFENYLNQQQIEYSFVRNKIIIEALWNELIINKYSNKVRIDKKKIRQNINSNNQKISISYLMSEIFFETTNSKEIQTKYNEIKNVIDAKGFSSAALLYSSSSTSNIGGKLNWLKKDSLNKKILKGIDELKVNEYSAPIIVPGGFLILMLNEIKETKNEQNIEDQIKRIVNQKTNEQLNQFSKIYFNKIKKNLNINEY
tara:strand:- start:67 stop:999 length:933 start_codon:yes stop_codon:yes gene_type:complete